MSRYVVDSKDLSDVADAIRSRGETSDSLEFPDGFVSAVGDIGNRKFTSLVNGTIESVTSDDLSGISSIKEYVFRSCERLKVVNIPLGVKWINDYAFGGCTALTDLTISDSVIYIGKGAFNNCVSLESVELPDNITDIKESAFYWCTSLKSIKLPNNLISIRKEAFYGCKKLESISIPSSVTSIGMDAFKSCNSLNKVNIFDVASWCKLSFGYMYDNPLHYAHSLYLNGELLTDLVIPSGVTSIGQYAFDSCHSLISIVIPNSVTSISQYAFSFCKSLTSIIIPGSVKSISAHAFEICTSLMEVVIGDGVLSIGNLAFYKCTSLKSLIIGNSVTTIGYSFTECSSLNSITCKADNPPTISQTTFRDIPADCSIYVPLGSIEAYKQAQYWSDRAAYIQAIPE